MNHVFELKDILNSTLVKSTIKTLFKNKEVEVIKRPASIIIRLQKESEDKVTRIILLPPKGFTANEIKETNPHPEVRKAKIEIKGGVRPNKAGFNNLKDIIKYQYYTVRNVKITSEILYPDVNGENYREELKSSKQKFFVVKENGVDFIIV